MRVRIGGQSIARAAFFPKRNIEIGRRCRAVASCDARVIMIHG